MIRLAVKFRACLLYILLSSAIWGCGRQPRNTVSGNIPRTQEDIAEEKRSHFNSWDLFAASLEIDGERTPAVLTKAVLDFYAKKNLPMTPDRKEWVQEWATDSVRRWNEEKRLKSEYDRRAAPYLPLIDKCRTLPFNQVQDADRVKGGVEAFMRSIPGKIVVATHFGTEWFVLGEKDFEQPSWAFIPKERRSQNVGDAGMTVLLDYEDRSGTLFRDTVSGQTFSPDGARYCRATIIDIARGQGIRNHIKEVDSEGKPIGREALLAWLRVVVAGAKDR